MVQSMHTPTKPVTINIRTPRQSVNDQENSDMSEDRRDSHVSEIALLSLNKGGADLASSADANSRTPDNPGNQRSHSPSPSPEIEIEIGEPEDLEDDAAVTEIQIDGVEEDFVTTLLHDFPYIPQGETSCLSGAKIYYDHMEHCTSSTNPTM